MGRFLELFRPVSRFIPEVAQPERRVSFNSRLLWTGLALIIYLVMSEIPLYGISVRRESDALFTMRVIFASNHGTLMELGIGPIVTAGLIIQLLAGSGLIEVDFNNTEDRALFTSASRRRPRPSRRPGMPCSRPAAPAREAARRARLACRRNPARPGRPRECGRRKGGPSPRSATRP